MSVEHFQKFLYEIGYPLGINSMKVSDYIKVLSLLEIYTYNGQQSIFFYDVLTELTKYYMIHKTINDEVRDHNTFKKQEEIVEEQSKLFEIINNEYFYYYLFLKSISELKKNVAVMVLNPYYKNEKFKDKKKDKLHYNIRFNESDNIKLNFAWALKKISKFIRCYVK